MEVGAEAKGDAAEEDDAKGLESVREVEVVPKAEAKGDAAAPPPLDGCEKAAKGLDCAALLLAAVPKEDVPNADVLLLFEVLKPVLGVAKEEVPKADVPNGCC